MIMRPGARRVIMHIEYPEYYNKFHCLAGDCPDTCCKDWEVDVDEDTFYYYKVQEGELGKKLEQCLVEDGDLKYIPMKKQRLWRRLTALHLRIATRKAIYSACSLRNLQRNILFSLHL